jgi:hypothetical protein
MYYKLTIPRPTKAPTPNEELLKLDLIELCRKPKENVYELYDETLIALRNKSMAKSHKVVLIDDSIVDVIRIQHDLTIIRLDPVI